MDHNKKYKILKKNKINHCGRILYQIEALKDFGSIKVGYIGGHIEGEHNLSHEGNCWVSIYSKVFDNAKIFDNAQISGNDDIFGSAQIFENAKVDGVNKISGFAKIYGNSTILGSSRIYGNAEIFGNSTISYKSDISDNTKVFGDVTIECDARLFFDVKVSKEIEYIKIGKYLATLTDEHVIISQKSENRCIKIDELNDFKNKYPIKLINRIEEHYDIKNKI